MGKNGHLTTRDLCELFSICTKTVSLHVHAGKIKVAGTYQRAFRFDLADVIEYWYRHYQGRCVRCGILGEAWPDQGFMCGPCAYEVRTGRIWWPELPRRTIARLPQGRTTIDLGVRDVWSFG